MKLAIFLISFLTLSAVAGIRSENEVERAKQLKEYIQRERPDYEKREQARQDVLEALDRLNADQNRVRERISDLQLNSQELAMALDNLSMEYQKQQQFEQLEKKRLFLLLKIVYKLRKDGVLRFIVRGSNLADLGARVRVLFRTLRTHSQLTHRLQERANRLSGSQEKLSNAKQQAARLLVELEEQEGLLSGLLDQKKHLLQQLSRKQNSYQTALREFRQVSRQLNALFENLEPPQEQANLPMQASLPAPLESGKLIKTFGRSINQRFGTVTFQKGIEIEAPQNTQVKAVLDGTVEFDGWVKGLGNVLIIHHRGGLYSLNAHLFKAITPRGSKVKQGDTVALVGDTGNRDKPSLYFELRENGKAIDPTKYFSPKALQDLR